MKSIVLATALAVASTAAFAQATATHYYIVHDTTAKKCMVVTQKPAANMTSTTIVSEGKTYTSEADAKNAMKTIAVCKSM